MEKKESIVSYSIDEIKAKIARGETNTNWEKFNARSEKELDRLIAEDPDDAPSLLIDWSTAEITTTMPKEQITLRVDPEALSWFRSQGKGYQTLMTGVLKAYADAQQGKGKAK